MLPRHSLFQNDLPASIAAYCARKEVVCQADTGAR
jgi:hypothetical protein